MNRTLLGGLLVVLGALVVILSVFADPIGLGSGGGFGWKQIAGVVVGAVVLAAGAIVFLRARRQPKPEPESEPTEERPAATA